MPEEGFRPMATNAKKPARAKSAQPKAQSTAGAGPAIAQRSKDAKAFGKAAPKKVVPGSKATVPKTAAKPAQAKKPAMAGGSKIRTAANVAAGAVVATARGVASLAASVVGRGGPKAKAK
jgi:hypothetical protein